MTEKEWISSLLLPRIWRQRTKRSLVRVLLRRPLQGATVTENSQTMRSGPDDSQRPSGRVCRWVWGLAPSRMAADAAARPQLELGRLPGVGEIARPVSLPMSGLDRAAGGPPPPRPHPPGGAGNGPTSCVPPAKRTHRATALAERIDRWLDLQTCRTPPVDNRSVAPRPGPPRSAPVRSRMIVHPS